ncbi:MAG: ATP-binding protein [Clostridia bacterium]|nr:ATP-binding protein [Clostridia bacterium]
MRDKVIAKAKQLHEAKINALKLQAEHVKQALFEIPEVSDAYTAYYKIVSECMRSHKDPYLPSQEAYTNYLNILAKHGYDDSFGYKPLCDKCNDTGMVGNTFCDCFKNEYQTALREICEIDKKAPFSFKDSDPSVAQDENQKEALTKIYSLMEKYASKYPDVTKYNIYISGATGTGKTCLASSIARAAVENGMTVKFVSAYEFNSAMITAHTSPISQRNYLLSDYLDADFLIIDDLGTEPMTRNVTTEYLLLIINERTINHKATIITSNISTDYISERYGERIYSRLSDKANSLVFSIKGKDLRRGR